MAETTKVRKGQASYQGLLVTVDNTMDMDHFFNIGWKSKLLLGQSVSTFDQFRIAVGQYCRFGVAFKVVKANELYKRGSICSLVLHMRAVEAFLGYFQVRSAAGTVMCKAMHISKLCDSAHMFFSEKDDVRSCGALQSVMAYAQSVARAQKTESRLQAARRRDVDVALVALS